MSDSSLATRPSSFFNLHVEGVGYLNRVRTVRPKKGQEFLACTVAALRGSDSDVCYTKFDCRVSGADAQEVVKRLEADVAADKSVIIGFRIADIYPEMFTFEKGEMKGRTGVAIKGRLLRIKFAKVNGESIEVPQPAGPTERPTERASAPQSVAEDIPF
jgi:predicted Zn-dependent protease